MDSSDYSSHFTARFIRHDYDDEMQQRLDSPMPWIGMYVAAASAACSLAMAVDTFKAFQTKKLWFPCKYFSLNAFSLTILAVTLKLPVDLTSSMRGYRDKLARVSSLVLMSTAMANIMTSLGSMENNEITLNMAALGIFVVTIAGNVCIHISQMRQYVVVRSTSAEEVGSTLVMVLLFITLCCLALMVPAVRRYVKSKYNEMHQRVSNKQVEGENFTIDELRVVVLRYWVMAATGSPQFVIARSAISSAIGLMCLLMALTLAQAHFRVPSLYKDELERTSSNYKWSITAILYIQSIGVALGAIAPLFRWFLAVRFKMFETDEKSLRDEFKIESFWTLKLVEWRQSSISIQIRHQKCRRVLHDAKRLVIYICIGVQILFVLASKLVLLVSTKFVNAIFLCLRRIDNLKKHGSTAPSDMTSPESREGTELDLGRYVLLLEGEVKLPKKILENMCDEFNMLVHKGEQNQPKNLIKLVNKSKNFNGVREFDSNKVPILYPQQPPNCWLLPVVTLITIAIALPNTTTHKTNQLLSGVSEGIALVKLIEKTLDKKGELESIRNAADVVWVEVELYRKWQDKDLSSATLRGRTKKDTLQKFSNIAEKAVEDFISEIKDILMQNPLNWPAKVIAANSMYRITQTILLAYEHQTEEEMLERLSIIISDILAACLTNLARVIILMCHRSDMKEREESVSQAAALLGESREILEILQQRDLPSLSSGKEAYIDEWRASMEEDSENPL